MVEKELTDYVRDQRSLGVKDHSIHRSLTEAGYTEQEVLEAMKRPPSGIAALAKKITLTSQTTLTINIFISICLVMLILYFAKAQSERLDAVALQNQQAIESLNTTLNSALQSSAAQTDAKLAKAASDSAAIKQSVDSSLSTIQTSLQEYRYDSLRRDSTLSASIQEINNRSSTELSSLESEFNNLKSSTVDFSKIIPKATAAVVLVGEKNDQYAIFNTVGSGVFINSKGFLVTNEHVIDEIGKITVRTSDNSEYIATIVDSDADLDIALLKLTTTKNTFTYLEWADSDKVVVGQQVIAIGSPVGFQSTVTQGIISNTKRHITGSDLYYFQTDVAINKGNSGGPLIDKDGKIVGIATMKILEEGYEGLSFALRANDVKNRVVGMLYEYENSQ